MCLCLIFFGVVCCFFFLFLLPPSSDMWTETSPSSRIPQSTRKSSSWRVWIPYWSSTSSAESSKLL